MCDEIMNVFDEDWLFGGGSREPCLDRRKREGKRRATPEMTGKGEDEP